MEVKDFISDDKIRVLARDPGQYNRALASVEKLFEFVVNSDCNNGLSSVCLVSKCHGSDKDKPPYSITVKLNGQTGIVDTYLCDCFDFKKREGKECCKHVIAILIKYHSQQNDGDVNKASHNSPINDHVLHRIATPTKGSACKKKFKSLSFEHQETKTQGRSLPSWMADKNMPKKQLKKVKPATKDKDMAGFFNEKSQCSSASMLRTVYCILPEELMQYAKDCLEKEKVNDRDEQKDCITTKTTNLQSKPSKPSILDDLL